MDNRHSKNFSSPKVRLPSANTILLGGEFVKLGRTKTPGRSERFIAIIIGTVALLAALVGIALSIILNRPTEISDIEATGTVVAQQTTASAFTALRLQIEKLTYMQGMQSGRLDGMANLSDQIVELAGALDGVKESITQGNDEIGRQLTELQTQFDVLNERVIFLESLVTVVPEEDEANATTEELTATLSSTPVSDDEPASDVAGDVTVHSVSIEAAAIFRDFPSATGNLILRLATAESVDAVGKVINSKESESMHWLRVRISSIDEQDNPPVVSAPEYVYVWLGRVSDLEDSKLQEYYNNLPLQEDHLQEP